MFNREQPTTTDVKIASSHMLVFVVPYFRANAPFVQLSSVGEAKKPIVGQNYIAPENQVPPGKLGIHKVTTLDIDASTASSSNFSGSVAVPALGELSAERVSQMLREDTLKLALFEVQQTDMIEAINDSPGALATLGASAMAAAWCTRSSSRWRPGRPSASATPPRSRLPAAPEA